MAALTSTMFPSPSIVMMQSKAALRIARLARLALADAPLGAAALDELPDLRPQAAHRGQQLVVGRDARGGEELHDAEHLPGAADREGEGGAQARLARRPRRAAAGVDARRRRRSTPGGPSARPRRACPGRAPSMTERLVSAKAATGVEPPSHVCAQRRNAPSASAAYQSAPKSHASASPMAASRRGWASSSSGAEASTRATACSVRRSTATSDRSVRGGHVRRLAVRRASHIRWAPAARPNG